MPELVQLDGQGYPVFLAMPVPAWLQPEAQQAVQMCPSLALRLMAAPAPKEPAKPAKQQPALEKGASLRLVASNPSEPDMDVDEEWIAELSYVGRQIPRPIT